MCEEDCVKICDIEVLGNSLEMIRVGLHEDAPKKYSVFIRIHRRENDSHTGKFLPTGNGIHFYAHDLKKVIKALENLL